jgi:hypothetical protein
VTLGRCDDGCRSGTASAFLGCARERSFHTGLFSGSSFGGQLGAFRGRSVLVTTHEQLAAALAMIGLDGVARRIVVCPPDTTQDRLRAIVAIAETMRSCGGALSCIRRRSHRDALYLPVRRAGQAVLDNLREVYPQAGLGQAFASTEAGVGFEVDAGMEGFPADFVDGNIGRCRHQNQGRHAAATFGACRIEIHRRGAPILLDKLGSSRDFYQVSLVGNVVRYLSIIRGAPKK